MHPLRRPFQIVRANLRIYLALNALMYGLALLGFGLGILFPNLNTTQVDAFQEGGTGDPVTGLLTRPWLFAAVILGVNIVKLCLVHILLPSLVVPFAGILVTAYWALTTGIVLVPAGAASWIPLIPHSLTFFIEFQAYILLLLGAFILGRSWVRPHTIGAANRRQGYLRGLQQIGWLALPALALLIVGAIWEAFSLYAVLAMLAQQ
jgi:hypothetical protein